MKVSTRSVAVIGALGFACGPVRQANLKHPPAGSNPMSVFESGPSGTNRRTESKPPEGTLLSTSSTPSVVPANAPASEVQALLERVREVERSQQREDVESFLALFDQHAVWVTGGGRRLIGLDVIASSYPPGLSCSTRLSSGDFGLPEPWP